VSLPPGTNGSALPAEGRGSGQYGYRRTFLIWEAGMGLPGTNPYVVDLEATMKNF
jgi:hypothetical protein